MGKFFKDVIRIVKQSDLTFLWLLLPISVLHNNLTSEIWQFNSLWKGASCLQVMFQEKIMKSLCQFEPKKTQTKTLPKNNKQTEVSLVLVVDLNHPKVCWFF